jgi:hypothetical protein
MDNKWAEVSNGQQRQSLCQFSSCGTVSFRFCRLPGIGCASRSLRVFKAYYHSETFAFKECG